MQKIACKVRETNKSGGEINLSMYAWQQSVGEGQIPLSTLLVLAEFLMFYAGKVLSLFRLQLGEYPA